MVAVIQLAITAGASAGGFLFDRSGYQSTFALSAAILCGSALLAYLGSRAAAEPIAKAPSDPLDQR